MSTLYIVGTPIGNLGDITIRAIDILKSVDLILCEDARVSGVLLGHFGIKTNVLSYHQHSKLKRVEYIAQLLREGKDLALVSDAGTPGISDPGNKLIEQLNNWPIEQLKIVPIPGPSAITAAASISGLPMDRFLFLGFPPAKKKRKKFFEEAVSSKYPVIFYESTHRIIKTLTELRSCLGESDFTEIVICRELTKKFETIYRGTIGKVLEQLEAGESRGEFTVVLERR